MLRELLERVRQGHRTMSYPKGEAVLPDRFRGRPAVDLARCEGGCRACEEVCPTGAILRRDGKLALDLGRCLFCADCAAACSAGALRFGTEHRLAARTREELVIGDMVLAPKEAGRNNLVNTEAAEAPRWQGARRAPTGGRQPTSNAGSGDGSAAECRGYFGQPPKDMPRDARLRLVRRSFKLRQVSAGGCNACEADINVLGTIGYDLGRFGIQMVASPRHADGLLITGPVTENMKAALMKTYEAVPPPRIVIAVGACAISGGPYRDESRAQNGVAGLLPVDLWIPGCPPHPLTILDGLLKLTKQSTVDS